MALVETEIIYSNKSFDTEDFAQEGNYRLYDILWSDGRASQSVRPVSDGVVPIGLCVIPTNWFDRGEKARFVSLKYMNSKTPETGGLEKEYMYWGAGYGDEGSPIPFEHPENDPLIPYYVPYAFKNENSSSDSTGGSYYWNSSKSFKDLREQENWLYTLNYCKENPGKYAIGDINGKQNTINISVEGAYYEDGDYPDMKHCVAKFAPTGTQAGDWHIPAAGELLQFTFRLRSDQNSPSINDKVGEIAKVYPNDCVAKFDESNTYCWSSTVMSNYYAFYSSVGSSYVDLYSSSRDGSCQVVAYLLR